MSVTAFIEKSETAATPDDLFTLLIEAAALQGFDFAAYGVLTHREPQPAPRGLPPFSSLNFPSPWQDQYKSQNYCEVDPVVVHTPIIGRPYLWQWLSNWFYLNPMQQRIMEEASEAGLKNGVSIPLHGPWGRVAVVSFASASNDVIPLQRLGYLAALATQFHTSLVSRGPDSKSEPVRLSAREMDCLRWTAEGKSSWDISAILRISENTVNFHVKNAMRKLRTTSRTVAVIKALRLGLIGLPQLR